MLTLGSGVRRARKFARRKDVEYYMGLPYAIEPGQHEDGTRFARMPEPPGRSARL